MLHQRLHIDTASSRPVFQQLSDQLICLITEGQLQIGEKLPSSRQLAQRLGVNRKTIIAAYTDVEEQGYLEGRPGSGMFVRFGPAYRIAEKQLVRGGGGPAGFDFDRSVPARGQISMASGLRLTEGAPDVRLAELEKLYSTVRQLLRRPIGKFLSRYGDGQGDILLRQALADYLRKSRGIPATAEQLLITRGSQHAFQLCSRLLFRDGGLLAAATFSYGSILCVARDFGAGILRIPLDQEGIDVDALGRHPQIAAVRAVYLTPHHQYPTTVTLSAERRLKLLDLAAEYGFAILEDDYDYDFNYSAGPLLPLAATDCHQSVAYLGSFTKILAPTLRVGYLLGPPDFVEAALRHRLLTDRQGDLLLERALAHYITDGDLDRHLRKVRPVYQNRRDELSATLRAVFGSRISFEIPAGGMAIWAQFQDGPDYPILMRKAKDQQLELSLAPHWWESTFGMRLGFASLNSTEMQTAVRLLAACLD